MVFGVSGSFEGIVTVAVLVYDEVGMKATWKVQLLPGVMVCQEQRSLPATSINCAGFAVSVVTMLPIIRSATPFVAVFLTVNVATAFFPIFTVPKLL